VTLEYLTAVVALTWEFVASGYTAMNLMGAWFKRRCTARGGDAARRRRHRPSGGRELFTNRVGNFYRGKTCNSKYSWAVIQAILQNMVKF